MSPKSYLSGGIGIPEGGGKLLSRPDEAAVENLIRQEINITNIVQEEPDGGGGGEGGGIEHWIRFNAAGTKVAGENITVSRVSEGKYLLTASEAFASVGGFFQYGCLALPSAESGNGGDGVSPFQEFSDHNLEDTDDTLSCMFFSHPTNGKLYLLGPAADSVFIHDRSNFGSGPTIVDAGTYALQDDVTQDGCLFRDGEYVALSGKADTYGVRLMRTSDNTIFDLSPATPGAGNPADHLLVVAGRVNSGIVELWISHNGATTKKYTPDLGTLELGTVDITYTHSGGVDLHTIGCAVWDNDSDGYFWVSDSTKLCQVDPEVNSVFEFSYPLSGTPGNKSKIQFDAVQNRLLMILTDATNYFLYEFRGWTNGVVGTGQWRQLINLGAGPFISFHYDAASGVYFISNYSNGFVERFVGDPPVFLDHTPVDDTGDDIDVDYDNASSYTCFYSGTKGYVTGSKSASGQWKMIEMVFEGDEISAGSGGAVVANVLLCMYEILTASTAHIHVFRQLSPPQYADAEVTAAFVS